MKDNFIIVGDSIAYGIGDPIDGGWTSMLKKYAIARPYSPNDVMRVHVAAYPGATTSELVPKLDNAIKTYYDHSLINTVIVAIGINDSRVTNDKSVVNIQDYRKNLVEIINTINKNRCGMVFVGLTNIAGKKGVLTFDHDKNYINKIINEYDGVLETLCIDNSINYIKVRDLLEYEDLDDGLHPNNKGHKKIYEKVFKKIVNE